MGLPSITALFPQLPINPRAEIAVLIGGEIGKSITAGTWDTCCIRLSRALNYAGAPVDGWQGMANPYLGADAKVRAQRGADQKWYIYSTYDLRAYLTNRYGTPQVFPGNATEETVKGVAGIIMFGWFHVDLWDGTNVRNRPMFDETAPKSPNVLIWKTP
jgi:hypothetical protein